MLPTNVVSFMKKMVASEGSSSSYSSGFSGGSSSYRSETAEVGTTLSKLRHTLTSGISGTGAAGGVSSSSLSSSSTVSFEERSLLQKVWDKAEKYEPPDYRLGVNAPPISTPTAPIGGTFSSLNPPMNGGPASDTSHMPKVLRPPGSSCRVCVKDISDTEYFKKCTECGQKVCEDCASYSGAKEEEQGEWHCSICRRKLLSRMKQTIPAKINKSNSKESMMFNSPSMDRPLPTNLGVAHSLMSNLASTMASPLAVGSMAYKPHNQQSNVPSSPLININNSLNKNTSSLKKSLSKEENNNSNVETPNIDPSARRASTRLPNQRSIDKPTSILKDDSKERRPSMLRRDKEICQTNAVTRRRSDNEENLLQTKPALSAARRGHRASDYMLRDPQQPLEIEAVINNRKLRGDTTNNTRQQQQQPQDTHKNPSTTNTNPATTETTGLSGGSSEETLSPDGRRGRRRSIQRQKSCEEDAEDPNLLSMWSTGQLPIRRHSAQDPSRRTDHPDFQKNQESLDVPQGRVHRHHSWDYDISRGNKSSGLQESLLPNATPAQCSRFSSDSDMSNESHSERGSMMNLEEQRRRASTSRRTSYRGIRVDDVNQENEDYTSNKGSHDVTLKNSQKKGATSSLEDDPWLHPTEDEYRSTRRRSSAVSDSGRVLPTPPASPRMAAYSSWGSGSSGGIGGRSSQSIESASSKDLGDETLRKQGSITDGEAIKIVIHDVDTDFKGIPPGDEEVIKRVQIKREKTIRGGGLGMRIVGGKTNRDGKLMATVVWTVPGGPAECAGVRKGDKVLKWNGVNLVNRNFEDVCSIIEADESTDIIDVMLESSKDGYIEGKDDNPLVQSQRGSLEHRVSLDGDLEKSLMSASRRKLPKLPGDMFRAPVSGKIQLQVWFDKNSMQLIVTVLSAHDLRLRDGYLAPEPFVSLRLFPHIDSSMYTTPVSEPSIKPMWDSSFLWDNIHCDALMGMTLEITIWDCIPEEENGFLGECLVDLRHAFLDERPTWYRLHERRSRSANTTPRGSITGYADFMPTVRRPSSVKSGSDYHDGGDDSRHSSMDSGLLHPDLAYRDSRRGSSVSEQAENEIYELTRSYPHSLPQSRRSSFAHSTGSPEFKAEDLESRLCDIDDLQPPMEARRRANSCRVSTQRELLEEAGWKDIGQTPHWLSTSTNVVHPSTNNHVQHQYSSSQRRYSTSSRSNSLRGSDLQVHFKGSSKLRQDEDPHQSWRSNLGPGQVVPRAYRDILTDDFTLGEIRLELSQTRGYLEVEVSNARGLRGAGSAQAPDTYVKTYLKEGDRRLGKRKTRVIRQSCTPNFYQTIRYPWQDLKKRTLLVMVWENQGSFDHNVGIGVAEIAVHKLELRRPVTGWYRLLPLSSVDRVVDDSD